MILLNGHRLNARGASIHEDDREEGGALSQGTRRLLVHRLRDLGATITRSHYPLHPAFLEAFDKYGILYWVDAPVYQLPNVYFDLPDVRAAAERAVGLTVRNNINHPSVMTWSLANEPAGNRSELGNFGPACQTYIRDAAAAVREQDDTRFVAIDRQSRVGEPLTSSTYGSLDVLGVNEYFGWYASYRADLVREPTTTDELSGYLDKVHAANPDLPLMITEFGAEAVRSGPVDQRGSLEFQSRYVRDHLRIHASKRYVAGSIHWALRDFRVDPTWARRRALRLVEPAVEQQEPDRGEQRPQAGLLRDAQALAADAGPSLDPRYPPPPVKRSLLPLLVAAALAGLPGCGLGSSDAGGSDDLDDREATMVCLDDAGVDARLVGDPGKEQIVIGSGADAPHIKFFLTSGQSEAAQFEGKGEGAEQIGAALLYVGDGSDALLEDVEDCLADL